jgi:hypothetical protein
VGHRANADAAKLPERRYINHRRTVLCKLNYLSSWRTRMEAAYGGKGKRSVSFLSAGLFA